MDTIIKEFTELKLELMRKIGQLEKAGFTNCQNRRDLMKQINDMNYDRYKSKYPTYLFFTDEAFDEIVKRNKLTVSTLETYTGYVPERCIEDVLNENIDREDIRPAGCEVIIKSSMTGFVFSFSCDDDDRETISKWSKEDIEAQLLNKGLDDNFLLPSEADRHIYGEGADRHIWPSLFNRTKEATKFDVSFTLKGKDFSQLYIAAPASMIDDSKKIEKKSFFKKVTITKQIEQPLDPIVFRYVRDGILVITFWK
jgi:hypothetical protein